ncbi:MAG: folate-binding protein YgfZ [Vicinamibacterales bacterium]
MLEADYRAARTGAILLERKARARILVSGGDRRTYLHALLTNDIAGLVPGRGCYAAFLTPQGRMIADMRVLDIGDLLLVELEEQVKNHVLEQLDRLVFGEDVAFGDVSSVISQMGVHGPAAARSVRTVIERAGVEVPGNLDEFPEHSNFRSTLHGEPLVVAASREFSDSGFEIYAGASVAKSLADSLLEAGVVRAREETAEVLRIERGRPLFGVDMDLETIPLEAGIERRAISFTKGCYPGQEVIVRVVHRGHGRVARRLVLLALETDRPVPAGCAVEGGDKPEGRVTSSAFSPEAGRAIALAYVHRDLASVGTRLSVRAGAGPIAAEVTGLAG